MAAVLGAVLRCRLECVHVLRCRLECAHVLRCRMECGASRNTTGTPFAAASAGCVRCTLWALARRQSQSQPLRPGLSSSSQARGSGVAGAASAPLAGPPWVYLVSDDPLTGPALEALLPPGVLSSPLLLPAHTRPPLVHIDLPRAVAGGTNGTTTTTTTTTLVRVASGVPAPSGDHGATATAAATASGSGTASAPGPSATLAAAGFVNVFVELVALSACDVLVHTKSGFRCVAAAVHWVLRKCPMPCGHC